MSKKMPHYDPETGIVTGVKGKPWSAKANGYIVSKIDQKQTYAHRYAFYFMTGEWPKHIVDHINGDKTDNRWCNLRECTHSQNHFNVKLHPGNTSGQRGVHKSHDKWQVRFTVNGEMLTFGRFADKNEAIEVAKNVIKTLHGEFAYE